MRVQAAAEKIGYVLNHKARNLRSRTSTSIGVLISDLRNPFYADLAAGIEEELRSEGHQMILVNDNGDPDEEMQAAETLLAMQVAGVIVTPVAAACPKMPAGQRDPRGVRRPAARPVGRRRGAERQQGRRSRAHRAPDRTRPRRGSAC